MKKLVAALLAGVMVFSLAACGEKEEDFDAKGYVEGVLDATYHGDYAGARRGCRRERRRY